MKNSWHVATAAEAITAAQFARCGWDISVQYGANQPEYDLVAVDGSRVLKISVKGSQDGAWGLTQSYKEKATYHEAIDTWLQRHGPKTVFCFVQFYEVQLSSLPRMYLAMPEEIAVWLKNAAKGRGVTTLSESHAWTNRAHAAGTIDVIPDEWRFTADRVNALADRLDQMA
ncbi:MAG: hypothetical protein HOO99_04325 [Hyphomicrobiaceae bacterium]|nr:hypothetical protein [Hyphomicrobiaceae bacterium]